MQVKRQKNNMTTYEIISKKRDGFELNPDEIREIVLKFSSNGLPDYQMAAWLMAVYFQGMTSAETALLTETMLHSGEVIDLTDIPGVKVDKHSTGGVGDKTSIILAPIVAAAGVPVPMISGRGLGHTGGTLDKLESIPGFRVNYSIAEFKGKIAKIGVCLIGQTPEIVPADRKMYALRDVTATIQSIPLITGSIMSKKLAEGIDGLILDVKTGRGAFMQTYERSVELAKNLIAVGKRFGKRTAAYITDMNQPLGKAIGNWLEIRECIDCLQNEREDDLMTLTHQLAGAMICFGGKAASIEEGVSISKQLIANGKAWNKFLEIMREQNGDVSMVENPQNYPGSAHCFEIEASRDGYLAGIDALELGFTSVSLGAGRMKSEDAIDPKAGILLHKKVGDPIIKGEQLMSVFTDNASIIGTARTRLQNAVTYSVQPAAAPALIRTFLDKNSLK
jgi:pyrimidine-nucleoside phosphorylase